MISFHIWLDRDCESHIFGWFMMHFGVLTTTKMKSLAVGDIMRDRITKQNKWDYSKIDTYVFIAERPA
jgi:hypothetical protein